MESLIAGQGLNEQIAEEGNWDWMNDMETDRS